VIGLRPGQNANDKIEIRRRKPRPTIRLDHRGPSMSISDAAWQAGFRICLMWTATGAFASERRSIVCDARKCARGFLATLLYDRAE
jgi:hypothetical protein